MIMWPYLLGAGIAFLQRKRIIKIAKENFFYCSLCEELSIIKKTSPPYEINSLIVCRSCEKNIIHKLDYIDLHESDSVKDGVIVEIIGDFTTKPCKEADAAILLLKYHALMRNGNVVVSFIMRKHKINLKQNDSDEPFSYAYSAYGRFVRYNPLSHSSLHSNVQDDLRVAVSCSGKIERYLWKTFKADGSGIINRWCYLEQNNPDAVNSMPSKIKDCISLIGRTRNKLVHNIDHKITDIERREFIEACSFVRNYFNI